MLAILFQQELYIAARKELTSGVVKDPAEPTLHFVLGLQAFLPILYSCLRTSPLDRTECLAIDGAQQYLNRSRSAPRAVRRTAELSSARMFRHRGPTLPAPVKGGIDA